MVQIIKTPAGDELAVLPRAEYERLMDALEAREHAAAVAAVAAGTLETITDKEVSALLAAPTPLAFWRSKRGLTQRQLAKLMGISQSFFAEIEAGKKIGEPVLYKRAAEALGVPMDGLVVDRQAEAARGVPKRRAAKPKTGVTPSRRSG